MLELLPLPLMVLLLLDDDSKTISISSVFIVARSEQRCEFIRRDNARGVCYLDQSNWKTDYCCLCHSGGYVARPYD